MFLGTLRLWQHGLSLVTNQVKGLVEQAMRVHVYSFDVLALDHHREARPYRLLSVCDVQQRAATKNNTHAIDETPACCHILSPLRIMTFCLFRARMAAKQRAFRRLRRSCATPTAA